MFIKYLIMNWYNNRGDYYVITTKTRTGEIIDEKKVVLSMLFLKMIKH